MKYWEYSPWQPGATFGCPCSFSLRDKLHGKFLNAQRAIVPEYWRFGAFVVIFTFHT